MTENQKTNEIAAITQQIAELKEKVNNANAEAREHVEKRDKVNEQFGKTRQEINELRTERDSLNAKVQSLKLQRDENRGKIKQIIEELKAHSQKIAVLKKKTPNQSQRELQKELEEIEWKIQTTSLDSQEEKRLVENVKQIEIKLSAYKKIDKYIKAIAEMRKELEALKTGADGAHQELTDIAKKSQNLHAKMMTKISESKTVKDEADRLNGAHIQAKEQAKPLHEEIRKLTKEKKRLQVVVQEEDKKRKKNAEQALKEKLETEAREKLQRGEKLSWNEFQLLSGDDSEDP